MESSSTHTPRLSDKQSDNNYSPKINNSDSRKNFNIHNNII
jgi:hypothetical protein